MSNDGTKAKLIKTEVNDRIVQPVKTTINWINSMHEFTMLLKIWLVSPTP